MRNGKGKERERGDFVHDASRGGGAVGRREDDDGWTESFLPTYVYYPMKVKKRFEHMRVSFILFSVSLPLRSAVVSSSFPLVLATKSTPSTYKSRGIPLLSSSAFRMIAVITNKTRIPTSHGNEPMFFRPLLMDRENPLNKYFFAFGLPGILPYCFLLVTSRSTS